jgi:NAD(P)-dependent dehydrogenase (short-subunit alcohol dehydrogenase family)
VAPLSMALRPGLRLTPLLLDGKPQEVIDSLKGMLPLERSAEPEVIAEGVTFLAGPGTMGKRPVHLPQRRSRVVYQ